MPLLQIILISGGYTAPAVGCRLDFQCPGKVAWSSPTWQSIDEALGRDFLRTLGMLIILVTCLRHAYKYDVSAVPYDVTRSRAAKFTWGFVSQITSITIVRIPADGRQKKLNNIRTRRST